MSPQQMEYFCYTLMSIAKNNKEITEILFKEAIKMSDIFFFKPREGKRVVITKPTSVRCCQWHGCSLKQMSSKRTKMNSWALKQTDHIK